MSLEKLKLLNQEQINNIIRMAWADRISFEEIEEKTELKEDEVINLMRRNLKAKSFRMWRKRVNGRITKHRKRFRNRQKKIKDANLDDAIYFTN